MRGAEDELVVVDWREVVDGYEVIVSVTGVKAIRTEVWMVMVADFQLWSVLYTCGCNYRFVS